MRRILNFLLFFFLSLLLVDFEPTQSSVTFSDIGGCEETLGEVCKLLVHMKHPEVFCTLGVIPPRGFLLHGPPGCGKTLLAHAIAGVSEFKVTLLYFNNRVKTLFIEKSALSVSSLFKYNLN